MNSLKKDSTSIKSKYRRYKNSESPNQFRNWELSSVSRNMLAQQYQNRVLRREMTRRKHSLTLNKKLSAQRYFSDEDETILFTDASPHDIGAVLVQTNKEGEARGIEFTSKTLSQTKRRYPQTQKLFLIGQHFILRTNAQGIGFIFKRDHERIRFLHRVHQLYINSTSDFTKE